MASINKVILVGRVGRDPELRYTPDGVAVANFSMATSESFKGKDGSKKETTEWHYCVAWRKLGEIIGEYVKKGKLIYVEGKIQSREYEGKDGSKKKVFEIILNDMKMLDGGKGEGGSSSQGGQQRKPSSVKDSGDDGTFVHEEDDVEMPV